jgi:hypothetical protein
MNHTLTSGNQSATTGVISPVVYPVAPAPPLGYLDATETFYVNGGCPLVNDFDVPGQAGASAVAHRYANAATGRTASLNQPTPNAAVPPTTARFFLSGFGFDVVRDDELDGTPDYVGQLHEILLWFSNVIDEPVGIPTVAYVNRMDDNCPNPFNPVTTIKYSIVDRGRVSLRVYNTAGQLVRTLVDEEQAPRAEGFAVNWDGINEAGQSVASGVYFYRFTTKNFSQTKKTVYLKVSAQ